ncbi:MAG: hypothetical protein WCA80_05570 [Candidatus Aquilonibacter sp.]
MRALVIAGVILALLASGMSAPSSGAVPQTSASAEPLALDDCSTAQLADIIAAYMPEASPQAKATPAPLPMPPNAKSYLVQILRARLAQCSALLRGSHAQSACTPSNNEDLWQLWPHLKLCETLVHPPQKAPTGIAWQLPSETGTGSQPVIFVIGIGDAAMVGRLVSTLVGYLNQGKGEYGYQFANNAILVPEPSWSPEMYATQCASSPAVQGAIVVDITAAGSGSDDEFIHRRNWTAIDATALYAQCDQKASSYIWMSDIAKVENHKITLTPLTPLALLLTLAATYEVFAPARQTATATTNAYPNPSPIPPGGRVTQVVTTNQTTINASSLGGVAGGFLGSSIAYTNSAVPLSQQPVDSLTWDTLQTIAVKLMGSMNCWHPALAPKESPNAQDVIGAPRTLPAYNAPVGLGRYTSGTPSAPFCKEPSSESIHDILP